MKKLLLILMSLVAVVALSACGPKTCDTGFVLNEETNECEAEVEAITSVTISGLEHQTVLVDTVVDLLDGVTVTASDDEDYTSELQLGSNACTITDEGTVTSASPVVCDITYSAVVGGILERQTINVEFEMEEVTVDPNAAVLKEWTFDAATDLDGWGTYTAGAGSIVSEEIVDGAWKLVTTSGGMSYETRKDFMNIPFQNGTSYQITFDAKVDAEYVGKKVRLQVGELLPAAPWYNDFIPGQEMDFTLTAEWQTFTFTFTHTQDCLVGGIIFAMGDITQDGQLNVYPDEEQSVGIDATIYYDNIKISGGSNDDIMAPSITGADNVTLYIEDAITFDAAQGVTANDFVDGDVTADIVITGADAVDTSVAGEYTVTYTVSDAAGNEEEVIRVITVMNDTEAPVITGAADRVIEAGSAFDALEGVTASDLRDGAVDVTVEGTVDNMTAGDYVITYKAVDALGNESSVEVTITVKEIQWVDAGLLNGEFADDSSWGVWYADWNSTSVVADLTGGAAVFDITDTGDANWNIQLFQEGLTVTPGFYKVTFDASSTVARDIRVKLIMADASELEGDVTLSADMTTFTIMYEYTGAEQGAKLDFELGIIDANVASVVTIDNVKFEEVYVDDNMLSNGDFADNSAWGVWYADWNSTSVVADLTGGAAVFDIADTGDANWNIQLFQEGLTVKPGMTYTVTFDASSTVGRDIRVKLIMADASELQGDVTLSADMTTFTVTFDYTAAEQGAKLDFELGIIDANVASVVTIDNVRMVESTTEVVVEEPVTDWTGYGWEVAEADGVATFTYAGIDEGAWWNTNAQNTIDTFDGTSTGYSFTFTGTAGHLYLFKIEGGGAAKELGIAADGTEQTLVIPFDGLSAEQIAALNLLVVFCQNDQVEEAGTLVISAHGPVAGEGGGEETPATDWTGYGWTITEADGVATMEYAGIDEGAWWNTNAQNTIDTFDGTSTGYSFTFTGTAGHLYLFKIEGGGAAKELGIAADGTEQTLVIPFDGLSAEQIAALNLLVVFCQNDQVEEAGTLVISAHGPVAGEEAPASPVLSLITDQAELANITAEFTALNTATVTAGTDSLDMTFTGGDWGGMFTHFDGDTVKTPVDLSAYTTIEIKVTTSVALTGLEFKVEAPDGSSAIVNLASYTPDENGVYSIPMADFVGFDFTQLSCIGFWNPSDATGFIAVDISISGLVFK